MTASTKWFWLVFATISGFLCYVLAPVLTPFVAAAILAYIADPLVDRLEARKLSRTLSVTIVFVVLTLLAIIALLLLVPLLENQVTILTKKVPVYIDWLQQNAIPWLTGKLGMDESALSLQQLKSSSQEYWKTAGGIAAKVFSTISRSGFALINIIANLLLITVVTFYLLRDWDYLVERVHELLPRKSEPVISHLAKQSDEVLGAFLRGQLLVMLVLAIVYSAGLMIIGLDLGLLIGTISGLVSFVPYLGFIVGIMAALLAVLFQFQELMPLLYVAIVFGIGQMLEGMLLTPLLVGDRIGLHPVAVIFAVLAGGQLFGFVGVLLALPVAAVIAVILGYLHDEYKKSTLYG
ncbi:MAG: AI-2E family transporter [Gammaproteobacteria bacterium]|jgi:predicted PurR-regulated permease PerM